VAETVEKKLAVPAKNVTLPGTRTSETIGVTFTEPAPIEMPPGTSTVVTVEGGGSVSKRTVVTVTTPSRVVHEATRVLQVEEEVVIMVVVHHCPAGTAFYNGICAHIARGKG
jgi:hypothetical protein